MSNHAKSVGVLAVQFMNCQVAKTDDIVRNAAPILEGAVDRLLSQRSAAAGGRFVVRGIAPPEFRWEDGKFVVDVASNTDEVGFNPDRARPDWRAIPVATQGPSYVRIDASMILPDHGKGFALTGPATREAEFANTRIVTSTSLSDGELRSSSEVWQALGEIAADGIPEAKRQARRTAANATGLVAPAEVRWR